MKKPLYFYLFLIGGSLLTAVSCAVLGFMIYFISRGSISDSLALVFIFPIVAGCGIALILYSLKILKSIKNVATLISLYPDFIKTDSFEILTHGFKRSELLIDSVNKNFILLIKDQIVPMCSFKDIISYNVYENYVHIFEGTRKNIGTEKNLGHVGVVGGNILSDYVKSLQVIITINNPQSPNIVINFIGIKGVDRLSSDYLDLIKTINKLCLKLDFMLNS